MTFTFRVAPGIVNPEGGDIFIKIKGIFSIKLKANGAGANAETGIDPREKAAQIDLNGRPGAVAICLLLLTVFRCPSWRRCHQGNDKAETC